MKIIQSLMLLLGLMVLITMFASCSWRERPSLITNPPTTAFPTVKTPIPTAISELTLEGATETLIVQFETDSGTCESVKTKSGKDLNCEDVQIELKQLFICTLESNAKRYGHKANTIIKESKVSKLLFEGERVYCAPLQYLSEGAVFQFHNNGGKNIRCRKPGGDPLCPP